MQPSHHAIGTALSSLVNLAVAYSLTAHVLPSNFVPLTGAVQRRSNAGRRRDDGAIVGALQVDIAERADLNVFMDAVFGGWVTPSVRVYMTLLTEDGWYNPMRVWLEKPTFQVAPGGALVNVQFPLFDAVVQSVTKAANASLTTSERLAYGDTSGGNVTLTLPAASAVNAHTVMSVAKTATANTLTVQRAGGDTLNGGTSVALTANGARVDLVSDGVSKWRSL